MADLLSLSFAAYLMMLGFVVIMRGPSGVAAFNKYTVKLLLRDSP